MKFMVDWTIKELDAAAERGKRLSKEILARAARFDAKRRMMTVDLQSGASFSFPVDKVQGLAGASDADLSEVELLGDGFGVHWEKLDVDYTVGGLAAGIFGTASYLASQAGQVKSATKAEAARLNGAKGGRPRKIG